MHFQGKEYLRKNHDRNIQRFENFIAQEQNEMSYIQEIRFRDLTLEKYNNKFSLKFR